MKNASLILTAAFVGCLPTAPYAQSGSAEFPSLAPTEVQITNTSSTRTVNFRVSGNKCSPPIDASLKPDHYGTYTCDGATAFNFSIITNMGNGSQASRAASLQPTKRYEVFFDSAGIWNIREVSSR